MKIVAGKNKGNKLKYLKDISVKANLSQSKRSFV